MLALEEPQKLMEEQMMISGAYLSKEAQDALQEKLENLPPAKPHHYQEARRRMM